MKGEASSPEKRVQQWGGAQGLAGHREDSGFFCHVDCGAGSRESERSRALTLALMVPKKSPILGFCVYADMYLCICVCVCLYVCIYVYLKNFFSFPESV